MCADPCQETPNSDMTVSPAAHGMLLYVSTRNARMASLVPCECSLEEFAHPSCVSHARHKSLEPNEAGHIISNSTPPEWHFFRYRSLYSCSLLQ
jgi:hypothetical protein